MFTFISMEAEANEVLFRLLYKNEPEMNAMSSKINN